jgi:hypothetical protein
MALTQDQEIDAAGEWVILDRFGATTTLLAVGNRDLGGASPRRKLTRAGREVLLPALNAALQNGQPSESAIEHGGTTYAVIARPIHIPDGSIVVGAYGVYTPARRPLSPAPLIGAWQWAVDKAGNNVGEDASQWDDNLYELHEFPKTDVTSNKGPVGDWLSRLLPLEDRSRVKPTVDAGIAAGNNIHQLLSFGAITRLGTPNPGRKQLALTGSAMPHPRVKDALLAYGFTREVPRPVDYRTTGLQVVEAAEFTRAYFALASDSAFAAVDCVQSYTFMTSPSWGRLGFHVPFEGDIAALAVEDQRADFEQFLNASRRGEAEDAHDVELLTADGQSHPFRVRTARVDLDAAISRYLVLSIEGR